MTKYKSPQQIKAEIAKLEAEANLRLQQTKELAQRLCPLPYGVEQQLEKKFDSRETRVKSVDKDLSPQLRPDTVPYMGLEEDYFDRLVFEDHRTKLPYWDDS